LRNKCPSSEPSCFAEVVVGKEKLIIRILGCFMAFPFTTHDEKTKDWAARTGLGSASDMMAGPQVEWPVFGSTG